MAENHVEYLITYTFHLDPIRAALIGLPAKMTDMKHVATDGSKEMLVEAVNRESVQYLNFPNGMPRVGVALRVDPSALENPAIVDMGRIFIFHNMICAITAEHKRLTGETPHIEGGVLTNIDGKEPVKH